MTRVFVPEVTEGQEWVRPVDEKDHDVVQGLDGTPRLAAWSPLPVEMLHEDEGSDLHVVDLPWVGGHALAFRHPTIEIAKELLASAGEFLELKPVGEAGPIWLFNATLVIDALDEDRSDLVRFPSTGRIMKVGRHEFLSAAVAGKPAFKVPQLRTLFVGEAAAEGLREAGFSGTSFTPVWAG